MVGDNSSLIYLPVAGLTTRFNSPSAHGLRKYSKNRLAQNGASILQVQTWVGHATLTEVQEYTRGAERNSAFIGTERKQNPAKLATQ